MKHVMLAAAIQAFRELFTPPFRAVLFKCVGLTIGLLVLLIVLILVLLFELVLPSTPSLSAAEPEPPEPRFLLTWGKEGEDPGEQREATIRAAGHAWLSVPCSR